MTLLPTAPYDEEETYVPEEQINNDINDGVLTVDSVSPTKTWRFNVNTGRIDVIIDDELALEQFVVKALRTARNRFRIYDSQYGNEVENLIGKTGSRALIHAEIPRLVQEALIYDDRINDVSVTDITYDGNKTYATVLLDTVYGATTTEVTL